MRRYITLIIGFLIGLASFGLAADMALPVLTVEFAPGDNWNVASPTWVDITDEVRHDPGFRIRRGRQTPFTRMRPSTLSLTLDNSTGNFDPDNSAGSYTGDLVPMVPIRVRATHNAVTYDLFRGFVTDWAVGQSDYSDTFTTVQAIDGLSVLQLLTVGSVWVEEVSADSPQSWYRFNEASTSATLLDQVGGLNGTINDANMAFRQTGPLVGETDFGINFFDASSTSAVDTTASLPIGVVPSGARTIEAWIKGTDGSRVSPIRVTHGAPGDTDFVFGMTAAAGGQMIVGTGTAGTLLTGSTAVDDSAWHHVVFTDDGSGNTELYVDGASEDTDAGSAYAIIQTSPWVGQTSGGNSKDGFVSELIIYGSELSAARVLAHYDAATAPWSGQLTSARIAAILDIVGWPAADRTLSTGLSTMQAQTAANVAALTASFQAQDTEDSELWIGGDGKVRFTNRQDRNTSTLTATFSNDGSDTPYRDFAWVSDDQLLRNVAQVTDSAGAVTESRDDASVTKYAPRTVRRTSNSADGEEIADYADWLAGEFGAARRRGLLTLLNAAPTSNADWAELLSRELGDLVSVENTPLSGGAQNQWDLFVEDIQLSANTEQWTMRLGLSPAVRQRMFTLDDDVLGKLDRATQGLLGW